MKASSFVVSIIHAAVPAIVLLVTGLTEQGIINAAIAEGVVVGANLVLKYFQERRTEEPFTGMSRSLAVYQEATPTWKRVLWG